jgi:hypothetical protein
MPTGEVFVAALVLLRVRRAYVAGDATSLHSLLARAISCLFGESNVGRCRRHFDECFPIYVDDRWILNLFVCGGVMTVFQVRN